jgi:hypothetical protein
MLEAPAGVPACCFGEIADSDNDLACLVVNHVLWFAFELDVTVPI